MKLERQRSEDGLSSLQESAIIPLLHSGDESAFARIVKAYGNPLYRFAYIRTQSPEVAEDIVQTVFIKLWENRKTLEPSGSLKAYLYRSTANAVIDVIRRRHAGARVIHNIRQVSADKYSRNDAVDKIELEELESMVRSVISNLPPRTREIYHLRKEQELSYEEISEILGITIPVIQNQVSKAVKALEKALQKWGEF